MNVQAKARKITNKKNNQHMPKDTEKPPTNRAHRSTQTCSSSPQKTTYNQ